MNLNIESLKSETEDGSVIYGGSIGINSIMDHFYKKDRLPLSNVFFINLFTLYTNIFKINQKDKNFQLFKDEISIAKLYIETYTSLVELDMPYFIIFYVPDYQYIPKNRNLLNTIDSNKTKKNKAYVSLMKEWESVSKTQFGGLNTSLTINNGISIYFIKYGDRYGLPYKCISRDINKIKLSDYNLHNVGIISHVPLDYFSINKKEIYLLERFTGNLLQNFDKKMKELGCNFNKFTLQILGDKVILAPHPKLVPLIPKIRKLSKGKNWKLKKDIEILKEINTLLDKDLKFIDFVQF